MPVKNLRTNAGAYPLKTVCEQAAPCSFPQFMTIRFLFLLKK